ncbi:hypothetical protein NGB36_32165 [Streptomyces sp. RB6PN25]|uniref:Uncharacterized protein n=1 Tax=Streptomyces humicola TaxID=2953240 RepID=A0ABT1Q598_9ACTN|nr:hypothetical protein [Streptomyces humicola]MCQ4085096.1 hypothetical protein [Streptomyces humicola]
MTATALTPIRGSTAVGPPPTVDHKHSRHLIGSTLRAIGVFADTAFRVVVLGTDGTRQPDIPRLHDIRR